jgi:hypothetical protein
MPRGLDADAETPRLAGASISNPAGTDGSAACPGGVSSATTSPRPVTRTPSPARTRRMYSLNRFLSSRTPTVFIEQM